MVHFHHLISTSHISFLCAWDPAQIQAKLTPLSKCPSTYALKIVLLFFLGIISNFLSFICLWTMLQALEW
jgi:hypothetical protein